MHFFFVEVPLGEVFKNGCAFGESDISTISKHAPKNIMKILLDES